MSIEIVLVPLAFALTKEIAKGVSQWSENKDMDFIVLETRMKDEVLLQQALEEWSCSFRKVEALEEFQLNYDHEVTFLLNEEGCYSLVLPGTADRESFTEWVEKVEASYTHYLQQSVYQNLIEQAREQGLILEKEELLEDNSIQVTYILNHR